MLATLFVLAANTLLRPVVNRIQRQPLVETFSEANYAVTVVCHREHQAEVVERLQDLLEAAHYPVRSVEPSPFGHRDVEIEALLYPTAVNAGELDVVMDALSDTPGVLQAFWTATPED